MNWFKHDSDATTDYKLKKLIMKYGTDGYAIYFHCLELIAGDLSETNITFELEHDAEIIADDLKVKGSQTQSAVDRVNEIMLYMLELRLFESSNNHIFCFKMLNRLDCSMTSNARLRKMITEAKENHDSVMISHDKVMLEEKRREEIRTEENRKEESESKASPSKSNGKNNDSGDNGEDVALYHAIYDPILEKAVSFANYKKEGTATKRAVGKLKTKVLGFDILASEAASCMVAAFFRLNASGNAFWAELTPSKFDSGFEQIWAEYRNPKAMGNSQGLRNAAKSDRYNMGDMVNQ